MHTEPRRGTIRALVLHDNEGPKGPGAAQSLAGYLQHIDGGYHCIVDDQNTIEVVGDQIEVWGNGGINSDSLDICMIGYASGQWTDAYSKAEIQRAALWCAAKCKQYGIPAVRLAPEQVATGRGICRHWDVTLAGFPGSAGHSDPGPNFDIDGFVRLVAALVHPGPPPAPKEIKDVICVPQPKKPPDSHGNFPHAQFLPASPLFPHGAAILKDDADVAHSVLDGTTRYWAPPVKQTGRMWVSMFGSADGRRLVLVDNAGATTDKSQGIWV